MAIQLIFNGVFSMILAVLQGMPQIPNFPVELTSAVSSYLDLLFENGGLVGFFVPINIIKIALPLAFVIVNFEHVYSLVIWVIKKIPLSID